MACEHKRIKSVNCVIMCADCGEELPIDYLVGKDHIAAQNAAKTPCKEETDGNASEPAEAVKTPVKRQRKKVAK